MVKLITRVLLSSILSLISLASFSATLEVSDNLIVSKVDDKIVEHGFIGNKSSFKISQGEHALILRYKDVFEDLEFAEERVVESKDFVIKFALANETSLKLTTDKIKSLSQADKFANSPRLLLTDEKNNQVKIEFVDVSDYQISKQVNIAVASLSETKAISSQSIPAENSLVTSQKSISTPQSSITSINVNSLTMLKYWWENASELEKEHFKRFTNKN